MERTYPPLEDRSGHVALAPSAPPPFPSPAASLPLSHPPSATVNQLPSAAPLPTAPGASLAQAQAQVQAQAQAPVVAGGMYRLSQQQTVAIVAAAAPALEPWDAGGRQVPPVRQIWVEGEFPGPPEGSALEPPGQTAGVSQAEVLARRRYPTDVLWFVIFMGLMGFVGYVSVTLGLDRWTVPAGQHSTLDFWPMYLVGEGIGCVLAWSLLALLALHTNHMMKIFVHGLTTYLAVIAVCCAWDAQYFWALFFACGALLQFAYAIAVVDRLAYTMLVVRKALGFVRRFPELLLFANTAVVFLAAWVTLWSFGLSGVVSQDANASARWGIIVLLAASLFWAGVVVNKVVHVMTADIITSWLISSPGSLSNDPVADLAILSPTEQRTATVGGPVVHQTPAADGERLAGSVSAPGNNIAAVMPPTTGAVVASAMLPASGAQSEASSLAPGQHLPATAAVAVTVLPNADNTTAAAAGTGQPTAVSSTVSPSAPVPHAVPPTRFRWWLLFRAFCRANMGIGSICYASLCTAPVSALHWFVRGMRARCGKQNECFFCVCACLFTAVETLTRFVNRFGYVTLAMHGQGFNRSSMDAWELFQSTGVDVLIAYDLSTNVVLMAITLGALLTGTAVGVWAWLLRPDRAVVVGVTSMLIGALLVSVTLTVVDATVAAMYVVYAEDPTLLGAVDAQFVAQLSEALLLRLQKRSGHPVVMNLASSGLPDGVPPR